MRTRYKSLHDWITEKNDGTLYPTQCPETTICSSGSGESIFINRLLLATELDDSKSIICGTTDRTTGHPKNMLEPCSPTECVHPEKSKDCGRSNKRVISDGSCP